MFKLLKRIAALVTWSAGTIVTLAGISTQPVMNLFRGSIPDTIAWIITLGAFYYAATNGFGWLIVVFPFICAYFAFMGPPTFLQSLLGPTPPEPSVESVDPNDVEKSAPKKSLMGSIILFILAITDTILNTTFVEEGKERRNRFWDSLFEEEEQYLDYEQVYGEEVVNNHPDELWIHINGMITDLEKAKRQCKCIYKTFGRPVKLMHNPTDGAVLDMMECMMGKSGLFRHGYTRPRDFLKKVLGEEMKKDYKKIVLVAHSQGTIITGNVIADFNDIIDGTKECSDEEKALVKDNMSKMEVFMVASAAHHVSGKHVSHLECLSNRGDVVAFLGHLFPKILKPFWLNTRGAGMLYENYDDHVEKSAWGHSLDPHYVTPIANGSFPGSKLATTYLLKKPKDESATETSQLLS